MTRLPGTRSNPAARHLVIVLALFALAAPILWAQGARGTGPAPPPQQKGTGIILGQVVDAASGQPIADATVLIGGRGGGQTLPGLTGGGGLTTGPPSPPPSLVTGADGRFVFYDLPASRIVIDVSAPGYVSGRVGQARPDGPMRAVELADGERNSNVKVRLWKFGVLSGTITDESGEPAVGATVRVFRRPGVAMPGTPIQSFNTLTDDRGAYRFSNLTPGDYLVVVPQTQSTFPAAVLEQLSQAVLGGNPLGSLDAVEALSGGGAPNMASMSGAIRIDDLIWSSSFAGAPGPRADGRLVSYPTLYYPGATTVAEATSITVRSGEERGGIDVQLRLVPASRISGVVTGADGPVANTGVRLVTDEGELAALLEVDVATAVSRADGTFLFLGVPPGRYRAIATKRSAPNMAQMMAMLGGGKPSAPPPPRFARTSVNVGSADLSGVTLALHEGATVSGRFEFQGASPRPQPGTVFNVQLLGTGGRSSGLGPPQAPPAGEAANRFKTAGYAPGLYRLTVTVGRGSGPPGVWTAASAVIDGRDALVEPFELTNVDLTDVVIAFTDEVVRLNGMVRVAAAPAATATVVVIPADYRAWLAAGASPARARTMPADRSGAFNLAGLRPGDYLIAAVDDAEAGDLTDTAFVNAVARIATRLTLVAGDNKQDLQVVKVPR